MKQNSSSRRGRGRAQGKRGGSQPGRSPVNGNRAEPKLKGNPKQLLDKYKSLARDAIQAGDRILAENYFQHADHYQRLVNERTQRRPEHQPRPQQQQQQQQPNFVDDGINGAQAAGPQRDEKPTVAVDTLSEPAPVEAPNAGGSGDEAKAEPAQAPRPRARRPRKPAPAPKADGDQPEVEI